MMEDYSREMLSRVWIWEYVLKYTSGVNIVKELTGSLAFPNDVPRLKQMTLVRELSDQVSKDLDLQNILNILEMLDHAFREELADEAGVDSEALVLSKRLKITSYEASKGSVKVRGLEEKTSCEPRHGAGEESVWTGLQQPIQELKEELRKLISCSACEEVDAQNAKVKAIEDKLSALIKNAWALFGPLFLEKAEAAVISGKYKPQGVSLLLALASGQTMAGTAGDSAAYARNENLSESAKRVLDEFCVELLENVSGKNRELEKARRALAGSCAELKKVVKDPLPVLLKKPDGTPEVPETTPSKKTQTAEPSVKRSLLEPHPSAQAQGWDDDEIQECQFRCSPSASRHLHLPPLHSPERTTLRSRKPMTGDSSFATGLVSKQRRARKKWSDEEVQILKREVYRYGKGNWKTILNKNKNVFHGRTEVDMKDKWRNLEKYGVL